VKHAEEIMGILDTFDLTGSYRAAAELSGCDHHTVARYVTARDAGELSARPARRAQLIDTFLPKLEEWVDASHGRIRADVAHDQLVVMGYACAGRGRPATAASTGPGCPSPGCGSSGTSGTARA
jgi:hypothetical protein